VLTIADNEITLALRSGRVAIVVSDCTFEIVAASIYQGRSAQLCLVKDARKAGLCLRLERLGLARCIVDEDTVPKVI
jgi:hypothetical protein